jgi:pimeloyl-ACP methyl ester carboxylesterase
MSETKDSVSRAPKRSFGGPKRFSESTFRFLRRDAAQVEAVSDVRGPLGISTLHESKDETCLVDIVFIHGLSGGSRKTWSAAPTEEMYWPKSWLPRDPDFREARIHAYGYDSNWGTRTRSILNIHDFAQSLLAGLKSHPAIRRGNTRIILVGHSMGGCVAKKTLMLAHENPLYEELASRFHSIFFLGTPHRGSNMAGILRNILQLTRGSGSKPYVDDLVPNSATLVEMNHEFRAYSDDLHLWSFFETLPMHGLGRGLVVDKYSATLGFRNEEVSFMDADHRNVCKFRDEKDPNYQKLRNALSSAVSMIKNGGKGLGVS